MKSKDRKICSIPSQIKGDLSGKYNCNLVFALNYNLSPFHQKKSSFESDLNKTHLEKNALGGLYQWEVSAIVRAHIHKIRYCYETELETNKESEGKLEVKFVIQKDGLVESVKEYLNEGIGKSLSICVQKVIKNDLEFPNPRGGKSVDVTYPFFFRLNHPK